MKRLSLLISPLDFRLAPALSLEWASLTGVENVECSRLFFLLKNFETRATFNGIPFCECLERPTGTPKLDS